MSICLFVYKNNDKCTTRSIDDEPSSEPYCAKHQTYITKYAKKCEIDDCHKFIPKEKGCNTKCVDHRVIKK